MQTMIGITCNEDLTGIVGLDTNLGTHGQTWAFLADDYIRSVENAGGIPILIPLMRDRENLKQMVSKLDGVIISGGMFFLPLLTSIY